MGNKKRKALIGEVYTNKYGEKFTIIGYDENNRFTRIIKFENGTIEKANVIYIKNGCNIYDKKNTKTISGVGINDVENGINHFLYKRWIQMIKRCYDKNSPNYESYGGRGVIVEEYLLRFSNYISFISTLDNYEELKANPKDYQIDKDLKGNGKIYDRNSISIIKKEDNLEEEIKRKRIQIGMYSLDGELLQVFESITEAEKITGIHRGNIARCVRKESKTAGGYRWESLVKNK